MTQAEFKQANVTDPSLLRLKQIAKRSKEIRASKVGEPLVSMILGERSLEPQELSMWLLSGIIPEDLLQGGLLPGHVDMIKATSLEDLTSTIETLEIFSQGDPLIFAEPPTFSEKGITKQRFYGNHFTSQGRCFVEVSMGEKQSIILLGHTTQTPNLVPQLVLPKV